MGVSTPHVFNQKQCCVSMKSVPRCLLCSASRCQDCSLQPEFMSPKASAARVAASLQVCLHNRIPLVSSRYFAGMYAPRICCHQSDAMDTHSANFASQNILQCLLEALTCSHLLYPASMPVDVTAAYAPKQIPLASSCAYSDAPLQPECSVWFPTSLPSQ